MGDYQDAYLYSVTTRNLGDSINDMSRKEQMIITELTGNSRYATRSMKSRNGKANG